MPGIAYCFKVLERTIAALKAGSQADKDRAAVMEARMEYARLGAIGPDLLRYTPVDKAVLDAIQNKGIDNLSVDDIAMLSKNPLMVVYGMLFRDLVVLVFPVLKSLHALLDTLDGIAAAEDTDELKAQGDEAKAVKAQLEGLPSGAQLKKDLIEATGGAVVLGRPRIQGAVQPGDPAKWRLFEFLRWKRTGRFARKLLELAGTDPELRAYAYGYLCHTAASVTSEPFINSIVGGPYRTHWWRNRLVSNFVDTWTHGFFETGAMMTADEPTPPYATPWVNLCDAKLHEKIKLDTLTLTGEEAAKAVETGSFPAGPLPDKLATLLLAAVQQTYEATPADFSKETLNQAYVGAFAVLWFMTGGEGPLCILADPGPPPCEEPEWLASGGSPPSAVEEAEEISASVIAAVILLIFELLFMSLLAGVAVLILFIEAAEKGSVLWEEFRCTLFWLRKMLFDAENGIRTALWNGALAYPMTRELGTVGPDGKTTPALDQSGTALCRSRRNEVYPFQMDASVPEPSPKGFPDLNFAKFPASALETQTTTDWDNPGTYPHFAVEGMGLLNGGMATDDGSFPTRGASLGDAVANAVQLIQGEAQGLVDYNLDGDRGYGWKTWRPAPLSKPKDPPVQPLPEA